ncbi:MAG: hypothetical protein WC694_03655 [Candidatus Paceibacterota bacterium]|jgi:hypothetical protein
MPKIIFLFIISFNLFAENKDKIEQNEKTRLFKILTNDIIKKYEKMYEQTISCQNTCQADGIKNFQVWKDSDSEGALYFQSCLNSCIDKNQPNTELAHRLKSCEDEIIDCRNQQTQVFQKYQKNFQMIKEFDKTGLKGSNRRSSKMK